MASKAAAAISLFSYPKVNLALDILWKTDSGYHEIQTVYHQLSTPADEIILEEISRDVVEVACNNPKIPIDGKNTALKAALLLKKHFGISRGVKITIDKKIPVMSGLGGGASNVVATLQGLAKLWGILCCYPELVLGSHRDNCILKKIAMQIGMDCAFFLGETHGFPHELGPDALRGRDTRPPSFISQKRGNPRDPRFCSFSGKTALGEHFGEKITPLPPLPQNIKFEIIETGVEISSHWAYQQINLKRCGKNLDKTKKLIEALKRGDTKGILENLHNDFEEFIFTAHPDLLQKKRDIESKKSDRVMLCGSGGALMRIYS